MLRRDLGLTPASSPTILNGTFKDGFLRTGGLVRILRDKAGKATGLVYRGGRVWDLRFRKVG